MDYFDMLLDPLRAILAELRIFAPRLAAALVVVALGWAFAKAVRFTLTRALRAINFNVLTERAGTDNFLKQGGIESDTVEIFGAIAYWAVVLFAVTIAFNGMGLTYITDLLTRVVLFAPRLIVALLIIVFGSYFARFVHNSVAAYCRASDIQDADVLGGLAQYAILIFVVLIALDQIEVGGDIIRQSFLIVLAGIVFALSLAFGLGGRFWAARMMERWWNNDERKPR
jgi:mechanosensitive ion channel-like protein